MYVTVENAKNITAVNEELMHLYEKWFKIIRNTKDFEIQHNYKNLSSPYLFHCSQSYFDSTNKVMMFGKEANDHCSLFYEVVQSKDGINLSDDYAKILADKLNNSIRSGVKAKAHLFSRARLLLSKINIDSLTENEYDTNKVNKALVNNLNKVSCQGKPPCCDTKILYDEFDFHNIKANIFIHELNILRPTHIVLACGAGYDAHIKRAFGDSFHEKIKCRRINNGELNDDNFDSTTKITHFTADELKWSLNSKYEFKVLYMYHPSAHLTTDQRKNYNEILTKFIEP